MTYNGRKIKHIYGKYDKCRKDFMVRVVYADGSVSVALLSVLAKEVAR